MVNFMSRLTVYLGKIKNRNAGDFYTSTVADEMGSIDSLMGGLSMAVGGIAAVSYTHLDVYKRQVIECLDEHRDHHWYGHGDQKPV